MELPIFQVDAFTSQLFAGNPAAVVPLEAWLPDETLLAIAAENNLSETAFFVPEGGRYQLRWFTPGREVDLCGHATLATAHVIAHHYSGETTLAFDTLSGELRVTRDGEMYWLDFPARAAIAWDDHGRVGEALGAIPVKVLRTRLREPERDKLVAVFDDIAEVRGLAPNMSRLLQLDGQGVVATAPGAAGTDFVSRYFVPKVGVPEDPVTGSTHCTLVPYWAGVLGKTSLLARQLSARGGEIACVLAGERVRLGGRAVQYLAGRITL